MLVTQLADAFEKGALSGGDQVCVMVESDEKKGGAMLHLDIKHQPQANTIDNDINNPF